MINYAYKYHGKLRLGVLNSDNEQELENFIPKGLPFWKLDSTTTEKLDEQNPDGIGKSDLYLDIEKNEETN